MHSRRRAPPRAPRRTPPHRRQARAAASTTNPARADPHAGRPGRRPGAAACAADGAAGAPPLACVARPALAPDPSVRRRAPARAAAACGAAAASAYAPRHHTVLSTCQNQSLFASPCFSLLLSVIILCRSFHAATSKPHSVNLRINSHDASTQRRPWVPRGARRQRRCVLHAVAPAAPAQRARKIRPVLGGDADAATEMCCGRRITPLRLSRAQASEQRARRSQRYYRLVVAIEQTDTSRVACECLAILVCAGPRSQRRVNGMVASRRHGGGRLNGGVASSGSLSLRRMKA